MRPLGILLTAISMVFATAGCGRTVPPAESGEDAEYLKVEDAGAGSWRIVSISPFDGSSDTLMVGKPLERLIVMSTSHVGFLEAIGATGAIVGVSGRDYVYTDLGPDVPDVGYDAAPDYERIVALRPDLILAYSVSAAKSPFISRLESLGIRTFIVNEHLEKHPLARASYVRLFGALTGRMELADTVLGKVTAAYLSLADSVRTAIQGTSLRKIILNIPYNDQWFVPSRDSYLVTMIADAGGLVLGTMPGKAASSTMSVEKAYSLAKEADCWLNVGWCRTMDQLLGANPIFPEMVGNIGSNAAKAGFGDGPVVWNDNARLNPKGGNDIWESGVVRPDIVLRDLVGILHPSPSSPAPVYYRPLK